MYLNLSEIFPHAKTGTALNSRTALKCNIFCINMKNRPILLNPTASIWSGSHKCRQPRFKVSPKLICWPKTSIDPQNSQDQKHKEQNNKRTLHWKLEGSMERQWSKTPSEKRKWHKQKQRRIYDINTSCKHQQSIFLPPPGTVWSIHHGSLYFHICHWWLTVTLEKLSLSKHMMDPHV